MYCKTFWGRIVTIIYAVIGIPIMLTVLSDLGDLLFRCARKGWNSLRRVVRHLYHKCCAGRRSKFEINRFPSISSAGGISSLPGDEDHEVNFPLPLAIFILFAYTFGCAATFKIWETEWDYLTAFYFFFISLSTIGLGDVVPDHPRYTMLGFGYIIIGLSLVSMCINIIQAKVQHTYTKAMGHLEQGLKFIDASDDSELGDLSSAGPASPMSPLRKTHPDDPEQNAVLGILQIKKRPSGRRSRLEGSVATDESQYDNGSIRSPVVRTNEGDDMTPLTSGAPSPSVTFAFDSEKTKASSKSTAL